MVKVKHECGKELGIFEAVDDHGGVSMQCPGCKGFVFISNQAMMFPPDPDEGEATLSVDGAEYEFIEEEVLVFGRISYDSDGNPIDNSEHIKQFQVGGKFVAEVGAPGIGRIVHKITRIDGDGIWGVEEENTVRELEPWETE